MMHRKLRLGLWLDDMTVPAWAYAMLERLHGSSYAEIRVIVYPIPASAPRRGGHWHTLIYDVFHVLDERLWQRQPNAFAPRHLHMLLKDVPLLEIRPVRRKGSWDIAPAETAAVRRYDLDVLIDLGRDETSEAMYAMPARYGGVELSAWR